MKLGDFELNADPYTIPKKINQKNLLIKTDLTPIPRQSKKIDSGTRKVTKIDYLKKSERSLKIGLSGELLVVEMEQKKLNAWGIKKEVEHKSLNGDGEVYDILSFNSGGEPIFIEVKTTIGGINTPFDISINEVLFANEHPDNYCLYRLFNYNEDLNSAEYYELNGSVSKHFNLEPTSYKAYYREDN